jgi:proteasome accessory factor A
LEEGLTPSIRLVDPVRAVRRISWDRTLQQTIERQGGPPITALEVQRIYQQEAEKRLIGQDEETDWILGEWNAVLTALETDPLSLADRLDWVAKFTLLDAFREEEGLAWNDPHLQSLDLAYHDIDPEQGLYYGLEQAGEMRRLVTDARIQAAISCPPANTRAFLRGLFVERFGPAIRSIGWNGIAFQHNGEDLLFDINPLVEEKIQLLNDDVGAADSLDQVVAAIRSRPKE